MDGFFRITFTGTAGSGFGMLVLRGGLIVGADVAGAEHDGSYTDNSSTRALDLRVTMRAPAGITPVQTGIPVTEPITRARQAAEALFTPKRQVTDRSASDSLPSADRSARKPRVLGISAVAPVRHEAVEVSGSSEQQTTPEIPGSQFARIRAMVKYGMTVPQVADAYGVAVGEIARILRKA